MNGLAAMLQESAYAAADYKAWRSDLSRPRSLPCFIEKQHNTARFSFMDLTQLHYFKTTAHMGSLSRAASTLFVTQSTLSKSITALEKSLGTKLFDRVGNSIQLNDFGVRFLDYAERILDLSYEAEQSVIGADDPETGTVTYSVPSGGILSDLESEYLIRHPNIHMRQRMLNAEQALAALQNRELDFSFSFHKLQAPGIVWRPLHHVRFVAIMSTSNPLASRDGIYLREMKNEKFFFNNVNSDDSQLVTTLFKEAGVVPDAIFEGDDLLLSVHFIRDYGAVSVSTDMNYCGDLERLFYAHESTSNPPICKIPILDETACVEFGVARLQGHYLNRTATAFYQHIVSALKE